MHFLRAHLERLPEIIVSLRAFGSRGSVPGGRYSSANSNVRDFPNFFRCRWESETADVHRTWRTILRDTRKSRRQGSFATSTVLRARNHRYRGNVKGQKRERERERERESDGGGYGGRTGVFGGMYTRTRAPIRANGAIGEGRKGGRKERRRGEEKRTNLQSTRVAHSFRTSPSADRASSRDEREKKEMVEGSHALGAFFRSRLSATVSWYSSLHLFASLSLLYPFLDGCVDATCHWSISSILLRASFGLVELSYSKECSVDRYYR